MYLNRDHDSPTHVVGSFTASWMPPRRPVGRYFLSIRSLPPSRRAAGSAIYALSNPMTHLAYLDHDITAILW